jgi:hypothetical protein
MPLVRARKKVAKASGSAAESISPEFWAVDRMPIASTLPTARVASTWRRLRTPQDLDLDFELND